MIKLDGYIKGVNLGGWLSQGSLEVSHLDSFIKDYGRPRHRLSRRSLGS